MSGVSSPPEVTAGTFLYIGAGAMVVIWAWAFQRGINAMSALIPQDYLCGDYDCHTGHLAAMVSTLPPSPPLSLPPLTACDGLLCFFQAMRVDAPMASSDYPRVEER
eukprot:scaffold105_cov151-Ochromonas_danica.AAC.2